MHVVVQICCCTSTCGMKGFGGVRVLGLSSSSQSQWSHESVRMKDLHRKKWCSMLSWKMPCPLVSIPPLLLNQGLFTPATAGSCILRLIRRFYTLRATSCCFWTSLTRHDTQCKLRSWQSFDVVLQAVLLYGIIISGFHI